MTARFPGTGARVLPVLAAGLLGAALLAAAGPAHAHGCDRTDNDRAEASRVLSGLTREIDVMEASIVEALNEPGGAWA